MIPVRLEIEGLYSYRGKQSVEFDQLTAAGLFGIFGAVGSGKSSILEAILLALYGSTERLAATGERSSMLNLQSDHLLVNFTFRAGKNNSQTFMARYSAKRNKKDREKVDTGEHIFYQLIDGNWEATDQSAEALIGMKKEHFKQTVIIPQGKFREFIDLTPGPRAEMMQQLFGLERFDLSAKTGSLLKATREEKIRLETQLKGLEDVSEEILEEKAKEYDALQKESQEATKAFNTLEGEFKKLESTRKSFLQLQEQKQILSALNSQKSGIEEKRQLHREFIRAKAYLRPVWDRLQDTQKDLEKYQRSVVDSERFKVRFEEEVLSLQQEEEELRKKNEERPQRESKIRDLKKVIEIKDLEAGLKNSKEILESIQPEIDRKRSSQSLLEKEIQNLESQLEQVPATDANQLADLKTSLGNLTSWKERIEELEKIKGKFVEEEKNVGLALEKIHQEIPKEEKTLETWSQTQKALIQNLEEEREKILRKQGLNSHVHLLLPGHPCPLCGSEHHPKPLESKADEKEAKEKEQEILLEKNRLEHILTLIQQQKLAENNLENHRRNIQEKGAEITKLESQTQTLLQSLSKLGGMDLENLSTEIKQLSNAAEERETTQKLIQSKRKLWQTDREQLELDEKKLQQAQLNLQSIQARIESKKEEIKDSTFCKGYFPKDREEIRLAIEKVEENILKAAEQWTGKQKHLQEKLTEQAKNLSDLNNFRNRVQELEQNAKDFRSEFEKLKVEHGFLDEEALLKLFHHSIDAEKVDLEIRQFDQKLASAQSRIEELQSEPGVNEFSEASFVQMQEELQKLKEQASDLQNRTVLLGENLKLSTQRLGEKIELEKSFALTENRESNLKELDRLFQGKGFVKFVSSIYLRELCNTANIRFMKLTKNSLSLEIDDNNTFWVVDYLNGGKKRLLKTLSGGQTFQASLCLALALAEKVKALNQADQSFFFLDEGFGALDRNALRVVFETLKSLRHENRIVGIISHVEELQQEIGVFAQVELDSEKGSQISYSF
ncbi:SMC family ATPase [Algoriphagus sp. CAU 1675]|uniref:SbcC/MukB-like Walker B domain-containing protein n=1 Tax=Algoriphagus sp. CAU 1675 TaxID=3032597 RepID=UPI0023DB9EF6|nr:SMC family ATPase [Algoriphagus sp. CAU 1675]MDF2158661.1 SMC family ATPase [Algoriphagus sp. CAU 1675]